MRAWIIAPLLVPATIAAQQDPHWPTVPKIVSQADEIRFAKTAAPADISKNAKVWVLKNGHYVVGDQGTSNVACWIGHSLENTFEPICGDAAADSTVMAIGRFRTEERLAGKTQDEINTEVTNGLTSGRFRAPQHPVLTYMESASQVLPDPSGKHRSQFMPHLMVFYPNMKNDAMGIDVASNSLGVPAVALEGTPLSHLIIVVHDWAESTRTTE